MLELMIDLYVQQALCVTKLSISPIATLTSSHVIFSIGPLTGWRTSIWLSPSSFSSLLKYCFHHSTTGVGSARKISFSSLTRREPGTYVLSFFIWAATLYNLFRSSLAVAYIDFHKGRGHTWWKFWPTGGGGRALGREGGAEVLLCVKCVWLALILSIKSFSSLYYIHFSRKLLLIIF